MNDVETGQLDRVTPFIAEQVLDTSPVVRVAHPMLRRIVIAGAVPLIGCGMHANPASQQPSPPDQAPPPHDGNRSAGVALARL